VEQELPQDKSIIDANPTKELFISMLTRDVSLRDAIGDLLDNSVDGALALRPDGNYKGLKVEIELDVEKDHFRITDNCGGIPVSVARDHAFRFGRSEGAVTTGHSVGVFGIGMKRALFRLGKWFKVESIAKDSSFVMEVDVEKWKQDTKEESARETNDQDNGKERNKENWQFNFSRFEEDLEQEYPEEKRGTIVTVAKLNDVVLETFRIKNDISKLIEELQREHLYSIDKGLEITINKKRLEAPELKLLVSDKLKTAYWKNLEGPVKVRI